MSRAKRLVCRTRAAWAPQDTQGAQGARTQRDLLRTVALGARTQLRSRWGAALGAWTHRCLRGTVALARSLARSVAHPVA
eukprot:5231104-Pyramimonas_sp.AAC.1